MPERIRFKAAISPDRRADIAETLAALADNGYTVTVVFPEEEADLGWRVLLDAPGRHSSFRVRVDATAAEWAAMVRQFLHRSN